MYDSHLPKNINEEMHLLVLWPNAQNKKSEILSLIKKYFTIEICHDEHFHPNLLRDKVCRIYGISEKAADDRLSISGVGPVTVILAKEITPVYETMWRFGTGYTLTNKKISKCKEEIRSLLGHPFLLHSSNDIKEAQKDSRILLGGHFAAGQPIPDEKFETDFDVFSYLSDVDDYLVLRDYSPGDIDVLTRLTPVQYGRLLGARQKRLRFVEFDDKPQLSPIDVVNVHHGIFCPIWCEAMLQTKEFDNHTGRFRPDAENLLFSLMYHYVVHKNQIPAIGQTKMSELIQYLGYSRLANINFSEKNDCVYHLAKFMARNNYSVPHPIDPKMYFDEKVATHLRNELKLTELHFDPQRVTSSSPKLRGPILTEKLKNVDLMSLAINAAKRNRQLGNTTEAYSKGNSICGSKPLLDFGLYPTTITSDGASGDFLIKVFHSQYQSVLAELDASYKSATNKNASCMNAPIFHQRYGDMLISIEKLLSGQTLEKFIVNFRTALTAEEIENTFTSILEGLQILDFNHGDVHAKNVMVTDDQEIKLIDFKFASECDRVGTNTASLFKSTSNDDTISMPIMIQYLKHLQAGGEIQGLYNPEVDAFIDNKFKSKFPKLKTKVRCFKRKLDNFDAVFLEKAREYQNTNRNSQAAGRLSAMEKYLFAFARKHNEELEMVRRRKLYSEKNTMGTKH